MNDSRHSDPAERRALMRLFCRNWRPTRLGRWVNRLSCSGSGLGLPPRFQAILEVHGRTSGRRRSNPIVIATVEGERYLVSMLGPESDWVKNVEAAHGDAVIRQGRRRRVHLVAVPPEQRAPILREYVQIAPGGGSTSRSPSAHHCPTSKPSPGIILYTVSIPGESDLPRRQRITRLESPSVYLCFGASQVGSDALPCSHRVVGVTRIYRQLCLQPSLKLKVKARNVGNMVVRTLSNLHELVQLRRSHAPVEESKLACVHHLACSIQEPSHGRPVE
jgi:F420H(2)-dependent quinone reductase